MKVSSNIDEILLHIPEVNHMSFKKEIREKDMTARERIMYEIEQKHKQEQKRKELEDVDSTKA